MLRISFKKERNIGMSKVSLTGSIISVKNNEIVTFESSLERDYILLLEYDDNVESYCEQPIKIEYFNGSHMFYVPDFIVKYKNKMKAIVEVKYSADLKENAGKYELKFAAAKEYCKLNGWKFVILTENDIRTDLLSNAKFFHKFKNPEINIDTIYFRLILDQLNKFGKITIDELLSKSAESEENRGQLQFVLWRMIALEYIEYDKSQKVRFDTLISLKK